MKKFLLPVVAAALLMSFRMITGPCENLIFFQAGTSVTMTSYDEDGKLTGTSETVYDQIERSQQGVKVMAHQKSFNKKGKEVSVSNYSIKCESGVLYFDMRSMLTDQQAESYKDFVMTVEGADKEIPSHFTVGEKLKDANIKFSFATKDGTPMPAMTMNISATNRKVEAKETITNSAGTFECYKISEDVEMKTIISFKMKSVYWFSFEAGTVKTESYKESGKMVGRTEITTIKKG